jgi:hypothetical protein
MKDKLLRLVFTAALGLASVFAQAQTNFADFRVKASDGDGKPLSGVNVKMYLNDILKTSDTTDSDGNALFQTLNPGTYRVELSKTGFSKIGRAHV